MEIDTNWCLTCACHFDQGNGPYCSTGCSPLDDYSDDSDDEIIYHHVDDSFSRSAAILTWATQVQPCSPSSSRSPTPSRSSKTPSPTPSTTRPKLMRQNQQPAPPALCLSTPRPALPSPTAPILTPQQQQQLRQQSSTTPYNSSRGIQSMGKASLLSGATESSIATPASSIPVPISSKDKPSVFGALATHVRSWVAPSPLLPSSPSSKRISPTSANPPQSHKFTILAHTHHSPALDDVYSPQSSLSDTHPIWHLSGTIVVDAPTTEKFSSPNYRPRGRKVSRA